MKFTPYSFSKMGSFHQCPRKFKLQYIDKIKIPFETNIALEKGKYLHHLIECDLKNEKGNFVFKLSKDEDKNKYRQIFNNFIVSPHYNFFKSLKEKYIEQGFSLILDPSRQGKNKLIPENYKNGKNVLVRGFIDFLAIKDDVNQKTAIIVDWKSGKYKEDQNEMQVMIYSIWAFLRFSQIEKVETYFYFIEHNKFVSRTYYREQLNELIKNMIDYIKPIEKASQFPKNITALCDWCPFKKFGHCDGEHDFGNFKLNI